MSSISSLMRVGSFSARSEHTIRPYLHFHLQRADLLTPYFWATAFSSCPYITWRTRSILDDVG